MEKNETRRLIDSVQGVKGIEKIIWAYTGAKRCSDIYMKEEDQTGVLPVLDALDLVYDEARSGAGFVKRKAWLAIEFFCVIYPPHGGHADLAAGMFYDLPYCCAKAYHDDVVEANKRFYAEHPFRNEGPPQGIPEDPLEGKEFLKELNEHCRRYGYPQYLRKTEGESFRLRQEGILPESAVLFLREFRPCTSSCNNFLSKSDYMLKSLQEFLDRERVDEIVLQSQKETLDWISRNSVYNPSLTVCSLF